MKIEINEQQPLDDVVNELERLHEKKFKFINLKAESDLWILFNNIDVIGWSCDCDLDLYADYKTVTLAELRSTNVEVLKEM